MEVAILLTTYNSGAFLEDLLRSLQLQSWRNWDLYIHDDLSTDNTLEIVNRFMQSDKRIHLLEDKVKRGAMQSFIWLLSQVHSDFYMFCDHDDIWKENKIEITLNKMLEVKDLDNRPVVVHTDLEVVDMNLNPITTSFWKYLNVKEKDFNDKYYHLAYNNVTGCTMMINNKAKDVSLPVHYRAQMHDSWITASVLWHDGIILSVPYQTILYRQHGKNTIGVNELPKFIDKFHSLRKLVQKTNRQAEVAESLAGMNRICFWLIKMYYMFRIYLRDTFAQK